FMNKGATGARKKEIIRQEKKKIKKELREKSEEIRKRNEEKYRLVTNKIKDQNIKEQDTRFREEGTRYKIWDSGFKPYTKKHSSKLFDKSAPGYKQRKPIKQTYEQITQKPATGNQQTETDLMPLNKFIAHAGICSRREAAELVKEGKTEVNGS